MALPAYAERIRDAVEIADPREVVRRIKDAVSAEFSHLDRRIKIVRTDYFNHTWVPDLVLQWPHEGASAERAVFLRLSLGPDATADDVEQVAGSRPIFFEIAKPPSQEGEEQSSEGNLAAVAKRAETLVTDAEALGVLAESRTSAPIVSLMTSALLQGGRGLIEEAEARTVSTTVVDGFEGARHIDAVRAGAATSIADEYLSSPHAHRVAGFLQAVWVGSGGRSTDFPGHLDLAGGLSDDGLQFLLQFDEIADPRFWASLGAATTIDQLSRLRLTGYSANLQHLLEASIENLSAKICRVLEDQPRLDELPEFHWIVERGLLALRGIDMTAYVATVSDEMTVERKTPEEGIPLPTLLDRANRHALKVNDLELVRGDKTLAYKSESAADVIHDPELDQFSSALGEDAKVRSATTRMAGDRDLVIDFPSVTARGRTAARFPLNDLVRRSLMLLRDLSEDDLSSLNEAVPARSSSSPQMSLDVDVDGEA